MSLILCRPETVEHPYYIEALGVHAASSQELVYLIYHHPLLVMNDFLNDSLIRFVGEELGQEAMAARLSAWKRSGEGPDEMLVKLLEICDYYTPQEINRYRQRLMAYRKMSSAEFTKATGDYYFNLRQYQTAVYYYQKILEDWRVRSMTDEFTAKVWNNVGASYAGIFWFEKALDAYEMSYNFDKNLDTLKRIYQLTLLNPELRLKERYKALLTTERRMAWRDELTGALRGGAGEEERNQLEDIFSRDSIKKTKEAGELLSSWKKEKQQLWAKKTELEEQCKPIRKKVDRLMKIRYQAYTVERAEERTRDQQKILIRNKARNQPER